MPPRWIGSREKMAAHAALAARLPPVGWRSLDPVRRELEVLERRPKPRPWLIDPPPPTSVEAELLRIADGTPTHWTSSLRRQLLADGLVEITRGDDGRWAGDRITAAGLRRIGR